MSHPEYCPPCPPLACFRPHPEGGRSNEVKPLPCSNRDVTFGETRKFIDFADKDCLPKRPPPDCQCFEEPHYGTMLTTDYPQDNVQVGTDSAVGYQPWSLKNNAGSRELDSADMQLPTEYKRADESQFPPCYMPQPNDEFIAKGQVEAPTGEFTGHQIDCGTLGLPRVTAIDWRINNRDLLSRTCNTLLHVKRTENNCKNTMARAYAIIDKTQAGSTKSVRERSQLVTKWKCTLERAIEAQIDEITNLDQERLRLKQSLVVLGMPYSIATECLQRRCSRPDSERIHDQPEDELYKELALIEEIRIILNRIVADAEVQQEDNLKTRQRLELDWSDKTVSNEIETINVCLNNRSTITMFHAGATRFPAEQSSEEYWEQFSQEILGEAERCRQKSIALRGTLNGILMNAARDLRNQADAVELAFTARIACMEEIERRLTNELKDCLQKLADTENLIVKMTKGIQSLDSGMKVAQTRLDNRTKRPNVENCRDATQYCLVEEVGIIQNGVTAMKMSLDEAENTKQLLMTMRGELEREIMLKRRTIILDRDRCMLIRSHFPSSSSLTGYSKV